MLLTVAICTWNRADLLRSCLQQLTALDIPDEVEWELIVVNNACTDHTDDVIREFEGRLPIRRVFEEKPGISNARNAAVTAASGRYILWTDDDVIVSPNWIRAYSDAITRHPDAAVFGGPIHPHFEADPPAWVNDAWPIVSNAFAARDLGSEEIELTAKLAPYGANFVTRADAQRRHLFDPHLGKTKTDQKGGEDLAVVRAILEDNDTGWWIPGASVEHTIPADRVTLGFLKRWFTDLGRTSATHLRDRGEYGLSVRLKRLRRFVISRIRLIWRRRLSPATVWMEDFRSAYVSLGYLKR